MSDIPIIQGSKTVYDLLYGGYQYKKELRKLFPKATIRNHSDDVHTDRLEITVEKTTDEEYTRLIVLNGFHQMSLNLQIMLRNNKPLFDKWMAKWQKDYPEYFKEKSDG